MEDIIVNQESRGYTIRVEEENHLVLSKMFGFFDVDAERLEASKMMFDMGTAQLYNEMIVSDE